MGVQAGGIQSGRWARFFVALLLGGTVALGASTAEAANPPTKKRAPAAASVKNIHSFCRPESVSGAVEMTKVGDVSVKFLDTSKTLFTPTKGGLDETLYGRRFLELRRRSFPAVMVV